MLQVFPTFTDDAKIQFIFQKDDYHIHGYYDLDTRETEIRFTSGKYIPHNIEYIIHTEFTKNTDVVKKVILYRNMFLNEKHKDKDYLERVTKIKLEALTKIEKEKNNV